MGDGNCIELITLGMDDCQGAYNAFNARLVKPDPHAELVKAKKGEDDGDLVNAKNAASSFNE